MQVIDTDLGPVREAFDRAVDRVRLLVSLSPT